MALGKRAKIVLLSLAAAGAGLLARQLSRGSQTVERFAEHVYPNDFGPGPAPAAPPTRPAPPPEVRTPPVEPVPDTPQRARTSESKIAELADRNARDVIAAVKDLSTEELRMLHEWESDHKQRKTVLEAIEKTAED